MYCTLSHLKRAKTEKYIRNHMDYSKSSQAIFTENALDEIYKISTGIPRMNSRICEKALMYG